MSESSAGNFPLSTAGPERTVAYRPLESRRIRRARLEAAEVAMELGRTNPPFGPSAKNSDIFGVVFSDAHDAAANGLGQE
ncbi:hypothetical protein [Demequina sp.]|uniref:hypothetical protein n=1 Tax=Demequina sp. TaxID=2050685 RepID=UPI0025C6B467|nr:hypothetical protein [Demequina sp.]